MVLPYYCKYYKNSTIIHEMIFLKMMYIEHLARKIGYGLLLVYQSVLLILRIKTDLVQEWMSIKVFKKISVNVVSILKDICT